MEKRRANEGRLLGRTIILTRPRSQAGNLAQALEELGASVLVLPTIQIEGPPDPGALDRVCRDLRTFDWLVFTSANAVRSVEAALTRVGGGVAALEGVSTCAVGPATARAMIDRGLHVDVVPSRYLGEAVLGAIESRETVEGKRILLPRSEQAASTLPRLLRQAGADVTEVVAYRTTPAPEAGDTLRSVLAAGGADLVVFTSGTAVHAFMEIVREGLGEAIVATIGPVTTAVAREYGMAVRIEAEQHTAQGLVSSILEYYT